MMRTIANKHVSDGFALNITGYVRVRGVQVIPTRSFPDDTIIVASAVMTSMEYPRGTFECSKCHLKNSLSTTEVAYINEEDELVCKKCNECRSNWEFARGSDDTVLPGKDTFTFTELMASVRATNSNRLSILLTCIVKNKAAKVIQVHARIFLARRAAATRRNLRMVLPVLIKRESLPKDVLLIVRDMCLGKST